MCARQWITLFILCILLIVFVVIACNRRLTTTHYTLDAPSITHPITFAILTDLHSSSYNNNMQELIDAVNATNPNAVLLVGDIFDHHYENENSWRLVQALIESYPCYYVTGNHEMVHDKLDYILSQLRSIGVHVLQGNSEILEQQGQRIRICGVDDNLAEDYTTQVHKVSTEICDADYHILLSHRPESVELYEQTGADLIISGHTHGGQWRIPGVLPNGLYAPHQGLFPKYTNGIYHFNDWTLLVSRGLDKQSVKYPRIFNRPEIVILTLE